jgi:hypothetical protein
VFGSKPSYFETKKEKLHKNLDFPCVWRCAVESRIIFSPSLGNFRDPGSRFVLLDSHRSARSIPLSYFTDKKKSTQKGAFLFVVEINARR